MNHIKKIVLALVVMLIPYFSYAEYKTFNPDATCSDFLREFDQNAPDYFEYYECRISDTGQTRPVSVIYKIDGKYAKQAEQYLIDKTGIGKLKHVCCYWESENGKRGCFINPKDQTYHQVIFESEETLSTEYWQDVTFYLMIEVNREEV